MQFFLVIWIFFSLLALGPAAFIFIYMKRRSMDTWPTKIDLNFKPKVSIIIPTFNEESIINYKLANTTKVSYPKDLLELVIVDSHSTDQTPQIIQNFSKQTDFNIKIVLEKERRGKSNALNNALTQCTGEIVIVSDADCFWPQDILQKALPFLADSSVGAIGGPKILFNSQQTWITRMEANYLKSANSLRLGESKAGSTVFFEGGFSAFKREAIDRFDPYNTGSDDCGSIICVIEKNFRAMLIKEAKFYSTFPTTFRSKISIKIRRINQLIRVFAKYLDLLMKGKLKGSKSTVIPNTLLYLVSPIAFIFFSALTIYAIWEYPILSLTFFLLLISKVRFYTYQIFENNILLFISLLAVLFGQKFSVWTQPEDRIWLTKENLAIYNLI